MLKILQAGLQQYESQELPDVQSGLAKELEIKLVNICWIIEKNNGIPEKHYLCFLDYTKAFDCMDHNKSVEKF